MNKYWRYFKIITKHKWIVFKACSSCGLIWRGIMHDLSKYNPIEFFPSARYFQEDKDAAELEEEDYYLLAWNHHKGHNPHHWEYWIDFDSEGNIILQKIPYEYIIEMICDWIGAGKIYSGDNWTNSEPYEYYISTKEGRYLHPHVEACVESCLFHIKNAGLDSFYNFIRRSHVKRLE